MNEKNDYGFSLKNTLEENQIYASSLFNEVKEIYKAHHTDAVAENRLREIQEEFHLLKNNEGIIYCFKALSIIMKERGDNALDTGDKILHYEASHDMIIEAVLLAEKIKWHQPALLKHQAIIKSTLADTLHQAGDHHDANLLDKSAFRTLGELLEQHPDYGEGHYIAVSTSFKKLKWSLQKMLIDLGKTESLLKKPFHTKHRASQDEVLHYLQNIQVMRTTINSISQVIN